MKKIYIFMLILSMLLVGCGSDDKSKSSATALDEGAKADMKVIQEKMLAADKNLPEMLTASSEKENAKDLFAYVSKEDYSKVDEYTFMYAAEGTAEEIAVIRVKSAANVEAMRKSVESHVATRIKQFETYDPSQVQMCKDGVVFSNGNYVVLVICKDVSAVKDAFYSCFEK